MDPTPELANMNSSSGPEATLPTVQSLDVVAANRFIYVAEAVIQPAILGFGMLTNIASLLVLRRVKKLAAHFKICLLALSMSNLCATVVGFCQLMLEVVRFGGNLPFGMWDPAAAVNYALYYVFLMFSCVSGSIVIYMAVMRNAVVLWPIRSRKYVTASAARWTCAALLGATVVIYAPTAFNVIWMSCYKDGASPPCVEANRTLNMETLEGVVNKYLYFISILYGPILLLAYIACVISVKTTLKRSKEEFVSMTSHRDFTRKDSLEVRDKATSRFTRTLFLILVVEIVCTLPIVAYGLGLILRPRKNVYDDSQIAFELFDVVAEIFICSRPTYNFWLYFGLHREFRRSFLAMFSSPGKGGDISMSISISQGKRSDEGPADPRLLSVRSVSTHNVHKAV